MKRRDFIKAVGRTGGLAVGARLAVFLPPFRPSALPSLLIPMDESQTDHLKAYGLAYRAIQAGLKAEWLLNYRGGAFLLPDGDPIPKPPSESQLDNLSDVGANATSTTVPDTSTTVPGATTSVPPTTTPTPTSAP